MDIQNAITLIESDSDFHLLRKFKGLPQAYNPDPTDGTKLFKVCFLDTETTSLDTSTCKVIDLAMRVVAFDSEGRFYSVDAPFQQFNDPGEPLSDEVKAITGYTDEMLTGKSINWDEVNELVHDCALVVAYNSAYDRPVLERYHAVFADLNWGCAMVDVDWFGLFGTMGKLEWLVYKIGSLFFEAHQALADVDIMIHMLSINIPDTEHSVFSQILEQARTKRLRVRAVGAPFEVKDELRNNGYRWEDDGVKPKAWCKSVTEPELEAELELLTQLHCRNPQVNPISAKNRFTSRV